uniref:Tctex1 domain containing 2 n=1 Tax=Monopterus albus TaxID=43700 RepID=A0A3Q3QXA3_MONAL
MEGSDTYLIRPNHQHKFKPAIVKEYIHEIVRERLSGVRYNPEEVPELSHSLADCIKDKVKNAGFDRYKLVVQVVIGEQRGQGVNARYQMLTLGCLLLRGLRSWQLLQTLCYTLFSRLYKYTGRIL